MSSCEFSKSVAVSDSNIPVPKRTHAGARRAKRCAQLPELQRYIETIIKASSECDPEEASETTKGKPSPRERKLGRYSVYKGNDNRAQQEKTKFDFPMSARKSKNKAKTPFTEAVSNADEISSMFVYDFEDPRNWKTDGTQNRASKPEIENFLQKLFPNPYNLETVHVVQKVDPDLSPEKKEKDDLGDETLAHAPIPNVRTETEVESEKTDNASVTADSPIKPCKRGSKDSCCVGPALSLENCIRPVSRQKSRRGSNISVGSKSNRGPPKSLRRNRSNNSTTDTSSRASSLESVSDVFSSHTQTLIPKRNSSKMISHPVSSRSSLTETKPKSSTEDFLDDIPSDYDIGKLKLLNMTDSDDSELKSFDENKIKRMSEDQSWRKLDDEYLSADLNDLQEIFDVMNKATESFFELSLKTDQCSMLNSTKSPNRDEFTEVKNNLTEKEEAMRESVQEDRQKQVEKENESECTVARETEDTETNKETEEVRGVESKVIDLLSKEEKLQLTAPDSQLWGEEEQKGYSTLETDSSIEPVVEDVEKTSTAEENQDAEQKIDEVLQFMYDCLKKFSSQKKASEEGLSQEEKKENKTEDLLSNTPEKAKPPESLHLSSDSSTTEENSESSATKSYPRVKEIQSESSTCLSAKRKHITRTRCKKKQEKNPQAVVPPQRPGNSGRAPAADSLRVTSETRIQTAESQNELGSYSEQAQVSSARYSDSHAAKPILPHSVKLKKSKTDTQQIIKDVLENEEKLLASYLSSKPPEKKALEKAGEPKSRKLVVRSGRTPPIYPIINDFKRQNSNFVICVSSLPRNLRTVSANRTSLTLSPSLSLSLSDVSRNWDIKPLPYYQRMSLKKIPVIFDLVRTALQLDYNVTQGSLLTVGRGVTAHIARPVCLKQTVCSSRSEDEVSLKSSVCLLCIRVKPIKKSLFVESSGTSFIGSNLDSTSPSSGGMSAETEGNQRVESLLDALEKTEGRLMLLEQNEFVNSESLSSCSGNDLYKCDNSEVDWEGENGHEKVHDLLQRTYNLQNKLHKYLHKMTCTQSLLQMCPLAQQERCSRFDAVVKNASNSDGNFDKPNVVGQQPPAQSKVVMDESTTAEIQTSDHATSYCPPSDESKKCEHSTDTDTKDEEEEKEDDDNSSVCSFKSSNDFSESNLEQDPKSAEKVKSKEYLKKIFNEIESFKQSFKEKKDDPSSEDSTHESSEKIEENRVTEYDPKIPAKVLKTVFKGKKSMTELTIGLKDLPMTKVSNISVEKRKFSPNHTKISICILKEKPEAPEKPKIHASPLKDNKNVLHNKCSTLYFDHIRPSLSRCRTDYSRTEDDTSKTSDSLNETSDDDDDFKSVASTLSSPDVPNDRKDPTDDPRKPAGPSPPKTFTKYRFDFYRKMDMSLDPAPPKPKPLPSAVCRYKELEPLKQALTEMQIRMRSIKQDAFFSSNDYYERALKLAKMSAGYCQSCGNRAVIPKDPFGYYKSLLPRRYSGHRHGRHFKMSSTPNPSFYSFRSSNPEVSDNFCDLDLKHSSSYLLNHTRPVGAFLRSSLHDMPILIERMP